jgi:hypothetical protein
MITQPDPRHRATRPGPAGIAVVVSAFLGLALALPVAAADTGGDSADTAAPVLRTTGRIALDAGHLAHPLGLADEDAAPYAHGGLIYEVGLGRGASRVELSYAGDVTLFDPGVGLGYQRHALGLEVLHRGADRRALAWSAGVQGALRRQDETYSVYDHDEVRAYVAARAYLHPRLMTRAVAGLRVRTYSVLPEESYTEPYVQLTARHFSPSRLTLGASLRLGGKWFHDPVAPAVWGTAGTPSTTQLAASLEAARGLSDRVSVRAEVEQRFQLGDFPYYVSEEIFDSPLLDRYARSGPGAQLVLKVLGPEQVWLQLGSSWRENDFGTVRFAGDVDGGVGRRDTVLSGWLTLERRLNLGGQRLRLHAQAAWTEQTSTLGAYTWTGPVAGLGMQWSW